MARVYVRHRRARDAGEDGDRAAMDGGKEDLVPTRGGKTRKGVGERQFLKKNQVWMVLAKECRQAAEIGPFGGVEGEEGKEGGRRLPIISIMRSHPGC